MSPELKDGYSSPPIVAMGANRLCLDSVLRFFSGSSIAGAAFVIVQLAEADFGLTTALRRTTALPIRTAELAVTLEPNSIYVSEPCQTVRLRHGVVRVFSLGQDRCHRALDYFLKSLATDRKASKAAVIFASTVEHVGAGLSAVEEAGGICLIEDSDSAVSLNRSGVLHPAMRIAQMPLVIARYIELSRSEHAATPLESVDDPGATAHAVSEILTALYVHTGQDFASYNSPTILRRVRQRMRGTASVNIAAYAQQLQSDAEEARSLAGTLCVATTSFFRDVDAWESLRHLAIRPLVQSRPSGTEIRAWVPASATGEEPCSLAILIDEEAALARKWFNVKIFATDIAREALSIAGAAVYPMSVKEDLTVDRLTNYFEPLPHGHRLISRLRTQLIFSRHDLLKDPPFCRLDLILCRNLLIYLDPSVRSRMASLFSFGLREGGHVLLGAADTLPLEGTGFVAVNAHWQIYRRTGMDRRRFWDLAVVPAAPSPEAIPRATAQIRPRYVAPWMDLLGGLLAERNHPTAVVSPAGELLYFYGDADRYLNSQSDDSGAVLLNLVKPEWRDLIEELMGEATLTGGTASVYVARGHRGSVRVTAEPLPLLQPSGHLKLVFETVERTQLGHTGRRGMPPQAPMPAQAVAQSAVLFSTQELKSPDMGFELERARYISSYEDFGATNSKLEATTEELLSATVALQSMNSELRDQMRKYQKLNGDLNSLLHDLDVAVVSLDASLRIQRFTGAMVSLLPLVEDDIGRPVSDLHASCLQGIDLASDAKTVLQSRQRLEREVLSESGHYFLQRVLPCWSEADEVEGVLFTFFDVTARKMQERAMARAHGQVQAAIEQMPAAVIILSAPEGVVLFANRCAASLLGYAHSSAMLGSLWQNLLHGSPSSHVGTFAPARDGSLERVLTGGTEIHDKEVVLQQNDLSTRIFSMSAAPLCSDAYDEVAVILTFYDISERKALERELLESSARERRQLQWDLHDGLGQELFGIAMMAQSMATSADREGNNTKAGPLTDLAKAANGALDTCRLVARGLSPVSDVQGGLVEALRQLAASHHRRGSSEVTFVEKSVAAIRLSAEETEHIYRIGKEALTNALKHSEANRIVITLSTTPEFVLLCVTDNGVGFRPEAAPSSSFGVRIMRYRATLLHATLEIDSTPSVGTRLQVRCGQPAEATASVRAAV